MTNSLIWLDSPPSNLTSSRFYGYANLHRKIQTNPQRTSANRLAKSNVKSAENNDNAISSGSKEEAEKSLRQLASFADKAAKKGVIHKNSASRLKALYTQRVAEIN